MPFAVKGYGESEIFVPFKSSNKVALYEVGRMRYRHKSMNGRCERSETQVGVSKMGSDVRESNMSPAFALRLMQEVHQSKMVFTFAGNKSEGRRFKRMEWVAIANKMNSIFGTNFTVTQVIKKVKNLKSSARKKYRLSRSLKDISSESVYFTSAERFIIENMCYDLETDYSFQPYEDSRRSLDQRTIDNSKNSSSTTLFDRFLKEESSSCQPNAIFNKLIKSEAPSPQRYDSERPEANDHLNTDDAYSNDPESEEVGGLIGRSTPSPPPGPSTGSSGTATFAAVAKGPILTPMMMAACSSSEQSVHWPGEFSLNFIELSILFQFLLYLLSPYCCRYCRKCL
ncbi:hypothetical protein AB6A40_005337 [Gnathostoma spinigerum]|uniref:Regulatory protein zeste n=1 Tax=Gnathostoma spinigerum TaxID=75299 RepID=A0ABD6ENS0_9BILA